MNQGSLKRRGDGTGTSTPNDLGTLVRFDIPVFFFGTFNIFKLLIIFFKPLVHKKELDVLFFTKTLKNILERVKERFRDIALKSTP